MKIAEIRELNEKELVERISALKAELNQMEINHSVTPVQSPAKITFIRKEIARLSTVLRQKSL